MGLAARAAQARIRVSWSVAEGCAFQIGLCGGRPQAGNDMLQLRNFVQNSENGIRSQMGCFPKSAILGEFR